jgi:hypothetical protein
MCVVPPVAAVAASTADHTIASLEICASVSRMPRESKVASDGNRSVDVSSVGVGVEVLTSEAVDAGDPVDTAPIGVQVMATASAKTLAVAASRLNS